MTARILVVDDHPMNLKLACDVLAVAGYATLALARSALLDALLYPAVLAALVVYAAKETKHLGELRFYADGEGVIERFTARYVELDEIIPDDPQMAEMTAKARKEIDAVQTRMAEAEAVAMAGKVQNSPYALSESCAPCHKAEYETWKNSRHSHAFAGLEQKQRIYDSACVGC